MDAIMKLTEGNPGALTAIVQMVKRHASIDPDAALGWIGTALSLDDANIRGSRIWLLYKDVCGQDMTNMLAVLRANQLGYLTRDELLRAINGDKKLDVADLLRQVMERLPDFAKETAAA
jgi:hypothetical protein